MLWESTITLRGPGGEQVVSFTVELVEAESFDRFLKQVIEGFPELPPESEIKIVGLQIDQADREEEDIEDEPPWEERQ